MVQPINYTLDVRSPFEQSLQGFTLGQRARMAESEESRRAAAFPVDMAAKQQAMQIAGAQEQRRAEAFPLEQQQRQMQVSSAQEAQARAEAMRDDLTALANNPAATAQDYTRLMMQYPEVAREIRSGFETMNEPRQMAVKRDLAQVYAAIDAGAVDVAKDILTERITAARNSGDEEGAVQAEVMLRTLEADPRAAKTTVGIALKALGGSEFDSLITGANANVQSSETIGGVASVITLRDGTQQIRDTRTNEILQGDAAQALLTEARQVEAQSRMQREAAATTGRLQTTAELAATAEGAKTAGKAGIEIGRQTFERLGPIRSNIANLDRAIELVEVEGANTGAIQRLFPNWRASTIELENLRNQLGLDVIGSVTFGALSEGELNLALNTALPTNLSEPQLADWLRRKKSSQEKLASYLEMQAQFLSKPGQTLDMWIEFTRSGEKDPNAWLAKRGGQQASAPQNDDLNFARAMQAKRQRGEPFTEEERSRLNALAGRGGQ